MKRRSWSLSLIAAVLVAACGGAEKTQVYSTDSGLAFEVPLDVLPANPGSAITGAAILTGPGLEVVYEYSDNAKKPASGVSDVRVSLLSIDGHHAYAEYFTDPGDTSGKPHVATLYVADAGGGMKLAMVIRSTDEAGMDQAKRIFRTVEFGEPAAVSVADPS